MTQVTWSDEVRRFHTFSDADVARAEALAQMPTPDWPERRRAPRAPFDLDAALARWDALLGQIAAAPADPAEAWKATAEALEALAQELWDQDGQPDKAEATFWFHVFTSPDLFTPGAQTDRDAFDAASWRADTSSLYDLGGTEARLRAFKKAHDARHDSWLRRVFRWLGWFLDAMLPPKHAVRLACSGFRVVDAARMLALCAPSPADHPTTKARVKALEANMRLKPKGLAIEQNQRDVVALLERIPSPKIATEFARVVMDRFVYANAIPHWVHVHLIDDADLSTEVWSKHDHHLLDWSSSNGMYHPARFIALFFYFGYARLSELVKVTAHREHRHHLQRVLGQLDKIHAPEMAAALYPLDARADVNGWHIDYLTGEGANAIAGLLDMAKRKGKKRDFALSLLGDYVAAGHGDLIATLLPGTSKAAQEAVRQRFPALP